MSHTYHALSVHIIFSTKDRLPMIDGNIRQSLHAYIAGLINNGHGATRIVNGTADHIHILADLQPRFSPADLLREIKSNSSRWVHLNHHGKSKFAWQIGYAIFSVSNSSIPKVAEYIINQEEHHRKVSFEEEYLKFLKKHGIQYDQRYIFD